MKRDSKSRGVAEKPRLSIDQIGGFRRFVRLRFPTAAAAGLEEAVIVCAWANAFDAERARRESRISEIEEQVSTGVFAAELANASAAEIKARAREIREERCFLHQRHKMSRLQKATVVSAAQQLIELVQVALGEEYDHGNEELCITQQHELSFLQQVAVDAWREVTGKRSVAKEWQKTMSGGRPLTICYDRVLYDFSQDGLGRVAGPHGRWGCGKIVPDSLRAAGDGMFRLRCEDCHQYQPKVKAMAIAKRR